MNGYVVVDASIVVKWLLPEVLTDNAGALARTWAQSGTRPIAPHFMLDETANAIYRRTVSDEISLQAAIRLVTTLLEIEVELVSPAATLPRAIELSSQLELRSIYDAHYLALAEYIDCELWAADRRFYTAANPLYPRVMWLGAFRGG